MWGNEGACATTSLEPLGLARRSSDFRCGAIDWKVAGRPFCPAEPAIRNGGKR